MFAYSISICVQPIVSIILCHGIFPFHLTFVCQMQCRREKKIYLAAAVPIQEQSLPSAAKCLRSFLILASSASSSASSDSLSHIAKYLKMHLQQHQQQLQRLLVRARALARLKSLPDQLLTSLLSQSDPVPEHVPLGVILFRQGQQVQGWYLLLAGEIQLYLDQQSASSSRDVQQQQLTVLRPGTLFGELQPPGDHCQHSCAARVLKSVEFVRIGQAHFLSLYNKWADQLQPCMLPMEDLLPVQQQQQQNGPSTSTAPTNALGQQRKVSRQLPTTPSERRRQPKDNGGGAIATAKNAVAGHEHLNGFTQEETARPPRERRHQSQGRSTEVSRKMPENGHKRGAATTTKSEEARGMLQLLELNGGGASSPSAEDRLRSAGIQLGLAMSAYDIPQFAGSEFCAGLHVIWVQWLGQPPPGALLPVGIGQTLLDRALILPAAGSEPQPQFLNNSGAFYQWTLSSSQDTSDNEQQPQKHSSIKSESMVDSLLLLANTGRDALLQAILRKSEEQRTETELDLVHEELSHIRAFNHLSRGMKRGLARVLRLEVMEHAGSVVFREGEPARSWFVVLKGALEAKYNGKKSKLREGDDFGKLALLNGTTSNNGQSNGQRRQATVVTTQNGCQLLRVDSTDFQRVLREVEASTVRLKHQMPGERAHQRDVLVLQRDPKGRHSLVAGQPEKIVEYVLETRVELGPEEELVDELLLTQPLWMPSNRLCDALKLYYSTGALNTPSSSREDIINDWDAHSASMAIEQVLSAKRRAVQFVCVWQQSLGNRFFLDPVANSFVEELYSYLLDDARVEARLDTTLAQMQALMTLREEAMHRISRPSRLVLDCGAYSANAPAPSPVLYCDICTQAILLPDTSQMTLRLQLDQSAAQIASSARLGRQERSAAEQQQQQQTGPPTTSNNKEQQCLLFELCPDGQKVPIESDQCSVPTMLSPGSILLAALPSERSRNISFPRPAQPLAHSMHSSLVLLLGPDRLARAMALFHFKLFCATSETELLVQLVGREQFPARLAPSNLDLLLRRFTQLQLWACSEVLLAPDAGQRLAVLQALVQLAQRAKAYRDLFALAALCLGLSALPVSRLTNLWARLPDSTRRQHGQSQTLLWPGRGHRNYRLFASSLRTPLVPFVPLLLKELDFVHEGRPSQLGEGLVSWEKMHLLARLLRSFRQARGKQPEHLDQLIAAMGRDRETQADEAMVRNLHAVEDQAEQMRLSREIRQRE